MINAKFDSTQDDMSRFDDIVNGILILQIFCVDMACFLHASYLCAYVCTYNYGYRSHRLFVSDEFS